MRTLSLLIAGLLVGAVHTLAACDTAEDAIEEELSPCPPGPGGVEADFLSLAEGDTLRFSLRDSYHHADGSSGRKEGVLTLHIGPVTCEGGERRYQVVDRRVGTSYSWGPYLPDEGTARDFEVEEAAELVETEEGIGFHWPGTPIPRYHITTTDTVTVRIQDGQRISGAVLTGEGLHVYYDSFDSGSTSFGFSLTRHDATP